MQSITELENMDSLESNMPDLLISWDQKREFKGFLKLILSNSDNDNCSFIIKDNIMNLNIINSERNSVFMGQLILLKEKDQQGNIDIKDIVDFIDPWKKKDKTELLINIEESIIKLELGPKIKQIEIKEYVDPEFCFYDLTLTHTINQEIHISQANWTLLKKNSEMDFYTDNGSFFLGYSDSYKKLIIDPNVKTSENINVKLPMGKLKPFSSFNDLEIGLRNDFPLGLKYSSDLLNFHSLIHHSISETSTYPTLKPINPDLILSHKHKKEFKNLCEILNFHSDSQDLVNFNKNSFNEIEFVQIDEGRISLITGKLKLSEIKTVYVKNKGSFNIKDVLKFISPWTKQLGPLEFELGKKTVRFQIDNMTTILKIVEFNEQGIKVGALDGLEYEISENITIDNETWKKLEKQGETVHFHNKDNFLYLNDIKTDIDLKIFSFQSNRYCDIDLYFAVNHLENHISLNNFKLSLMNNTPLRIDYESELFELSTYIAPRIEVDEEDEDEDW